MGCGGGAVSIDVSEVQKLKVEKESRIENRESRNENRESRNENRESRKEEEQN